MYAKILSREDKIRAIYSLMFTVEKRIDRVKARECAAGSKQRNLTMYVKSDWSLPTVTTEGFIIASTI